jgi:hypothetical protein
MTMEAINREFPLDQKQFERIFQTIYSALDGRAKVERSCIFFAAVGALILDEHFGIECQPCAGAALLNIGDEANTVINFGEFKNGLLTSSADAFHCWIETEQHAIDFMSPIYHENMKSSLFSKSIPRRMFVRNLSDMVQSLDDLDAPHAFALQYDQALAKTLYENFLDNDASTSLLSACKQWFKPYPHAMPGKRLLSEGRIFDFSLHGPNVDGRW